MMGDDSGTSSPSNKNDSSPFNQKGSFNRRGSVEKKLSRNVKHKEGVNDEVTLMMKEYSRTGKSSENVAEDILNYSIDEIDTPYILLSVIGDSSQFQPKKWPRLAFQNAILETVIRAEECIVMYKRPGPGSSTAVGSLVENTFKNHSIGEGKFITYRHIRSEKDTPNGSGDTGLCIYSHTHMSVCDLLNSSHSRTNQDDDIQFKLEKYIHEVGRIEIDFIEEVNNVPVVLILAEGDMSSIRHVTKAIEIDTIVYIIKGSGKAADLVADYIEDPSALIKKIVRYFGLALIKDNGLVQELENWLNKIVKKQWLINIFDIEKEEPRMLTDMISHSVSSVWTLTSDFHDDYHWLPNIYIPLAYTYVQKHGKYDSFKASSLLEQSFDASVHYVKLLMDNGTSLRKIYDNGKDSYVYSPSVTESTAKAVLSTKATIGARHEDKINTYRKRIQFLRSYCRKLVGYTTGKDFIATSLDITEVCSWWLWQMAKYNLFSFNFSSMFFVSIWTISSNSSKKKKASGYMSEELLSELFMFEFSLKNEEEMADIFWQRCPNQLLTALVMSAFLQNKSEKELQSRKRRYANNLMAMSNSFEARATFILDGMYSVKQDEETQHSGDSDVAISEEIFNDEPDEEFKVLSHEMSVMGLSSTPIEFAFKNEKIAFLSHSISQRYLHWKWAGKKAKSKLGRVMNFMTAPRTKFFISYFFFLLAMVCISIFILTEVRPVVVFTSISYYQLAFTIWIIGDFIEEFIVEIFEGKWGNREHSLLLKFRNWFKDVWNWLDGGCYLAYGLAIVVHIVSEDPSLMMARRLYSLTTLIMYGRFLRVLLLSKTIGTKVIMIGYMMQDLFSFLRILIVVIIGVGVAYHAIIYPNFSPLFYDDWRSRWTDARIFSIIGMPYWQIYGSPNLEIFETEASSYCSQQSNGTDTCGLDYSVSIITFLFMLFGNILLLNLVIAMFSNRFAEVESNSERVWNFHNVSIVMEYQTRLPSPFNFIIRPIQILMAPINIMHMFRNRRIDNLEKRKAKTGSGNSYRNVTPDGLDKSMISFQFQINTYGDVFVGIFSYPPDKSEGELTEIKIAGPDSTESNIIKRSRDILVTKDTENILNESTYREFQVTWKGGSIEVFSRTYDGNVFEKYTPKLKLIMKGDSFFGHANCICFHTSSESKGSWKIGDESAENYDNNEFGIKKLQNITDAYKASKEYITDNKNGYQCAAYVNIAGGKTSLIFKVKAKCDAHLHLFAMPQNQHDCSLEKLTQDDFEMIRIVIGGSRNTQSWITYINCQKLASATCSDDKRFLTPGVSQPFWVSWGEYLEKDGEIQQVVKVGSSEDVDENCIMRASLSPFPVYFIGVASSDINTAKWYFNTGKTILTLDEFNYKLVSPVAMNPTRKAVKFKVKAACDAHIALCNRVPSRCGENMFEIVIGGQNNSLSYIRNMSIKKGYLYNSTGKKLDVDNYRQFWITWADGKIRVGEGAIIHQNEFMYYTYGTDYQILYLAVSTGPDSAGYWKFDDDDGTSQDEMEDNRTFTYRQNKLVMQWKYNKDEVKTKTTELKWKRSQQMLSAACIQDKDIIL